MCICHDCVNATGGCCKSVFNEGWKIILLPQEVKGISELTGKNPVEFVDNSPLSPYQKEWYATRPELQDKLWARLFSRWDNPPGLKGGCPFLTKQGCLLPYQSKPFICQVFPLSFNITENEIFQPYETNCPVGKKAASAKDVLDYFNDDWVSLQRRFKMFRQECLDLLNQPAADKPAIM